MKTTSSLISDNQSLASATSRFGHSIPVYDDGFGPLFIHRDQMGISGIVRAQTWEDAYSICEDEFFPEASETVDELRKEYNFKRQSVKWIKRIGQQEEIEAKAEHYPLAENGFEFSRWETRETPTDDENGFFDNELFQEAFGFRPNGPNKKDTLNHGIYEKDLNGDYLDLLTPELLAQLEITLEITTEN
jgi:hypothetical protein